MKFEKRSWLSLIAFCTTAALLSAFVLAVFFASATIAYAVANPAAAYASEGVPAQSFSGVITDSHCGAKHVMKDKNPAECTRACVNNGSKYVLVDGDKMFALAGDPTQLAKAAGERVTVGGTLAGDTIQVVSITLE